MNRRMVGLSLYSCLTPPARWVRAAVAYADQEVAKLCSNHQRSSHSGCDSSSRSASTCALIP
jgi:hypothetical protein